MQTDGAFASNFRHFRRHSLYFAGINESDIDNRLGISNTDSEQLQILRNPCRLQY